MPRAFDPVMANFEGIVDTKEVDRNPFTGDVIHESYITVDAKTGSLPCPAPWMFWLTVHQPTDVLFS